jgi:hypothetical protein
VRCNRLWHCEDRKVLSVSEFETWFLVRETHRLTVFRFNVFRELLRPIREAAEETGEKFIIRSFTNFSYNSF